MNANEKTTNANEKTTNANEKTTNANEKPSRHYWFAMILYPDCARHLHFVEKVLPNLPLDVIGILHDKDCEESDDVISFDIPILKKPHLHLVLKTPVQRTLKGMKDIVKKWGVEERFIQTCEPFLMCAYLTHKTEPYKHQYSEEEIFGNIDLYKKYTSTAEITDFERFLNAMLKFDEYILDLAVFDDTGYYKPTYSELVEWIARQGLFHLLTGKGNFVYNNILREKAQRPIVYIDYTKKSHYQKKEY